MADFPSSCVSTSALDTHFCCIPFVMCFHFGLGHTLLLSFPRNVSPLQSWTHIVAVFPSSCVSTSVLDAHCYCFPFVMCFHFSLGHTLLLFFARHVSPLALLTHIVAVFPSSCVSTSLSDTHCCCFSFVMCLHFVLGRTLLLFSLRNVFPLTLLTHIVAVLPPLFVSTHQPPTHFSLFYLLLMNL